MFYNLEQSISFLGTSPIWFYLLLAWTIVWKGFALWKAAHKNSKPWFVVLLLINTVGILEILYLFVFSEQKHSKKAEKDNQAIGDGK